MRFDLSNNTKSIGHMMKNHRDEILAVKSSSEAHTLMAKLFTEANLNTPKTREILFKLNNGMSYAQTLLYLNNILMKSQGFGTYK